jgi:hypothetical protein
MKKAIVLLTIGVLAIVAFIVYVIVFLDIEFLLKVMVAFIFIEAVSAGILLTLKKED